LTLVTAGRVGRAHGWNGSFYVEQPDHPLDEGTSLVLAQRTYRVEHRAGTDERPLLRLGGLDDRQAVDARRGQLLLVDEPLAEGEWLAGDLVGCEIPGLGVVRRVLDGPSCEVLELGDGTLVPFVSDAIESVDREAGRIEVRREFLG
jgi:16S rRNA processing protein RimM